MSITAVSIFGIFIMNLIFCAFVVCLEVGIICRRYDGRSHSHALCYYIKCNHNNMSKPDFTIGGIICSPRCEKKYDEMH